MVKVRPEGVSGLTDGMKMLVAMMMMMCVPGQTCSLVNTVLLIMITRLCI
jgi:hypothetical protein